MQSDKYNGVMLVVGGCPSCLTSAKQVLRRCGFMYMRDYGLKYNSEMKGDPIFKRSPELGQFTSAFIYNPSAGIFVNLKEMKITDETKANVAKIFSSPKSVV